MEMGAGAIVVLARTQRIRDIKDMHMGNHAEEGCMALYCSGLQL